MDLTGKNLANRYQVKELIGRGGMAEVYKVWDSQRQIFLAMKLLHPELAFDKVALRRFRREAKTLAKISHPNIVRFFGLEEDNDHVFILMDYVDGNSLKYKIFKSKPSVPVDEAQHIIDLCSRALD
jgi:serine/threonine-protein kinase